MLCNLFKVTRTLALPASRSSAPLLAGIPVVRKAKKVQKREARLSFSCWMQEDNDGFSS